MAFPTIQTADTTSGTVISNSLSWTLTYPGNISAGDLLVAFIAADGNPLLTYPVGSGWEEWADTGAGAVRLGMHVKDATGSESGTFSVTLSASEQGAWRIFRITGWFSGSIVPGVGGTDSVDNAVSSTGSPSSTPNPPSVNPGNWDIEDTLWFAGCAVDTSRTISVFPLADHQTADVSGGAGGATLGLCTANSAVASLDPGTFTISTSDDWVTVTAAIRPAVAVAQIFKGPQTEYITSVMKAATW